MNKIIIGAMYACGCYKKLAEILNLWLSETGVDFSLVEIGEKNEGLTEEEKAKVKSLDVLFLGLDEDIPFSYDLGRDIAENFSGSLIRIGEEEKPHYYDPILQRNVYPHDNFFWVKKEKGIDIIDMDTRESRRGVYEGRMESVNDKQQIQLFIKERFRNRKEVV